MSHENFRYGKDCDELLLVFHHKWFSCVLLKALIIIIVPVASDRTVVDCRSQDGLGHETAMAIYGALCNGRSNALGVRQIETEYNDMS